MKSISPNLNIMIKATEKASKIIIRDFGEIEKLQVSKKSPTDFVTNTDLKVEKIIITELKKAKPNFSLISEESGEENNKDQKNTWIIDPIDGTVNFLHGIPHFAISLALKSNDEIISGLIYDPIKDEMFFAEKNNGAFFNNHRIRVSSKNNMNDCLKNNDAQDEDLFKNTSLPFLKFGLGVRGPLLQKKKFCLYQTNPFRNYTLHLNCLLYMLYRDYQHWMPQYHYILN